MRVSEMIRRLEQYQAELGDVEVLASDGYNAQCYHGGYEIEPWQDDDGKWCIDIGIGGLREE